MTAEIVAAQNGSSSGASTRFALEVPVAESDLVLISVDNHVAVITVNDPDRRNAVTSAMSTQLRAAVKRHLKGIVSQQDSQAGARGQRGRVDSHILLSRPYHRD